MVQALPLDRAVAWPARQLQHCAARRAHRGIMLFQHSFEVHVDRLGLHMLRVAVVITAHRTRGDEEREGTTDLCAHRPMQSTKTSRSVPLMAAHHARQDTRTGPVFVLWRSRCSRRVSASAARVVLNTSSGLTFSPRSMRARMSSVSATVSAHLTDRSVHDRIVGIRTNALREIRPPLVNPATDANSVRRMAFSPSDGCAVSALASGWQPQGSRQVRPCPTRLRRPSPPTGSKYQHPLVLPPASPERMPQLTG